MQAAFRFEETDVVPYRIRIAPDVQQRLDEHYGSHAWVNRMTHYFTGIPCGAIRKPFVDGTECDAFGVVTENLNILHVVKPALSRPSLAGYRWPDPEIMEDWDRIRETLEDRHSPWWSTTSAGNNAFRMSGIAFGLFERAWTMRGMQNFFMDLATEESFVNDLFDGILDVHLKYMDYLVDCVPIDAFFASDDWCDQRGPMMGVEIWRKFFKPRYAKLIAHAHDLGLLFICHSCGNLLPLIDDLLDIGLDGLESVQPEAMDVFELKRITAGKMILIGGLGVQSTMPFGSPRQVREQTLKLMAEMGKGGGYALAPAKPIMADVPIKNIVTLIETVCGQ